MPLREGSTRRLPLVLLILAAAFLIARIGTGVWEREHGVEMRWRTLGDGVAESRTSGKPILYDFTAAWCGPCRALNADVFSDPAVVRQLETLYVPVRVLDRAREDGRNPAWVDSLQRAYRITGFPMLVLQPASGGEPVVLDGYGGDKEGELRELAAAATRFQAERFGRPQWIIGDSLPGR